MLISGQEKTVWAKVGYIVFAVGSAVLGGILETDVSFTDAEGDVNSDASSEGVVRMPTWIRAITLFLLVFICVLVLVATVLAVAGGTFTDPESLGGFVAPQGLAAGMIVALYWLLNTFGCKIYYSPSGVTVRRGRRDTFYRWHEIGGYKQSNCLYIFHNTEGKRIFLTSGSYEGFDGYMVQYRRSREGE